VTLREIKQTSPERFTLVFDDGTELKTTLGIITERFIHSGMDFDEDAYNELVSACTLALAKARALRIINARPMSREELRKRLVEKGETPENAEECAEWLCQMGLINDAEYAGSVVRHYAAKGYGASRIKQELRRHGVSRELWDEAMSQMPEQDEYLARFLRSRLSDPGDRAQVKKVSDALFRRGYSWDQIKHALNEFDTQGDY
jgi:regulatory protein